jgi:hypothetical protein
VKCRCGSNQFIEINDNHTFQSLSIREIKTGKTWWGIWQEREREIQRDRGLGERERNTAERENGVGHLRRWHGLI